MRKLHISAKNMQEMHCLQEIFPQLATILHIAGLLQLLRSIDSASGVGNISSHLVETLLPTGHLRAGVADIRTKGVTLPGLWESG